MTVNPRTGLESQHMGLLRTAARTAVIAGTATQVHGRVAARQRNRWAEQTAAPTPPPQAPTPPPATPERDTTTMLAQLKELGKLRDAGVLTGPEFEAQKARILHC
jgi:hypothetical protein